MSWYFKEGTEERVEVLTLDAQGGDPQRWIINCGHCGENFTLRPEHGVAVGADGAVTTEHSFNCPVCLQWHRMLTGGVLR